MQHTHTQDPFRFWFISSMRTLAAVKIYFGLVTKLKIFFSLISYTVIKRAWAFGSDIAQFCQLIPPPIHKLKND